VLPAIKKVTPADVTIQAPKNSARTKDKDTQQPKRVATGRSREHLASAMRQISDNSVKDLWLSVW
jgi:hypothetical protein